MKICHSCNLEYSEELEKHTLCSFIYLIKGSKYKITDGFHFYESEQYFNLKINSNIHSEFTYARSHEWENKGSFLFGKHHDECFWLL